MRSLAEPLAVVSVVCTIAFLSLVIGELVPKSLAVRHADLLALWVARPIEGVGHLGRFAVGVLTAATGLVLRLLGQRGQARSPFHTIEDIRTILDEADAQGVLDGEVVKGAVDFQDFEARRLMTPRRRVVGIPRGSSVEEALGIARQSGYSRLPVFAPDLEGVDGIVYTRDLYEARERGRPAELSSLVRPALLVPPTKSAQTLMAEMRRAQRHMALVVNEHGTVVGLVTLEDIFELIVGDIRDEHDEPPPVVADPAGDWLEVDGGTPVRELNSRHGLGLPDVGPYVTVAGLVIERLGTLPRGGEAVVVEPYRLRVEAMEGRRVARVRIETVAERSTA